MSKFDKEIPKGSVPNGRLQIANRYGIRWFKCKLKPPENCYWKSFIRMFDEYLRQPMLEKVSV